MSKANSIYPWVQPSYSRVVFHLWRVWEKLSGRSLAVKSSVMSRQKLARHLSFVSPHFSTGTLSLSYMPELILTTRLLGVRCSCVVWFLFQVSVLIFVGASWDMPEHVSCCVSDPRARMWSDNRIKTSHQPQILFLFLHIQINLLLCTLHTSN